MGRQFNFLHLNNGDEPIVFKEDSNINYIFFNMDKENEVDDLEALFKQIKKTDLIFIQSHLNAFVREVIQQFAEPFSVLVDNLYWDDSYKNDSLIGAKRVQPILYEDKHDLSRKLNAISFTGQYGDKISPMTAIVNSAYKGSYYYNGNTEIILEGDFGDTFKPVITWKNNLFYDNGKVIEIFPQYKLEGDIELQFTFRLIKMSSPDDIIKEIIVTGEALNHPILIPQINEDAVITSSLKAKGSGIIKMGALHKRWSRLEFGEFIFGGSKYMDHDRDEFIYYLDPGDLKPPLNVYFSGYRTAEGFEGFYMMKKLGAPFLLFGDPRIEGGSFYIGSEDYEQKIKDVIKQSLEALGFNENELILSGLSMGSFGALYYGVQMNPSAIIAGKPLVNIGTISDNMRLLRPEDFGTALDVLLKYEHGNDKEDIERLNNKFWNVMKNGNFSSTTFAVSYMENDDYDPFAFNDLLPFLSEKNAHIISRGIPGRHNDDSPTITNWFINFYKMIMESKFRRKNQ